MSFLDAHLLTILTLLPLAGGALVFALRALGAETAKRTALAVAIVSLGLALRVVVRFDLDDAALQLVERAPWIPTLHVDYVVGVDGLSLLMVLLVALLVPIAIVAAWDTDDRAPTFFFFILALETGCFGAFTAQGFFHWFLYWEIVLVPAFFLVKMWGDKDAGPAALQFFLYTLTGSVALLVTFQAIHLATGTLDFQILAGLGESGALEAKLGALASDAGLDWSSSTCALLALFAMVFAFGVKTPLWPFHTWMAQAYASAPPAVTMLLTGVMSKMGVYAFLRIALPLFPDAAAAASGVLLTLAVVTIVKGSLLALAERDLGRMMAFSSLNHVGFCLLGLFAVVHATDASLAGERTTALGGVVLQMFTHGVTAAAMFFLLGALFRRTRTRDVDEMRGLRAVMPRFTFAFGVVLFASAGLPGLAGFVSELLVLKGSFALAAPWAVTSMIALVITALFLLRVMERSFSGPLDEKWRGLPDIAPREAVGVLVLIAFIVGVGVYPAPFVRAGNATASALAERIAAAAREAP